MVRPRRRRPGAPPLGDVARQRGGGQVLPFASLNRGSSGHPLRGEHGSSPTRGQARRTARRAWPGCSAHRGWCAVPTVPARKRRETARVQQLRKDRAAAALPTLCFLLLRCVGARMHSVASRRRRYLGKPRRTNHPKSEPHACGPEEGSRPPGGDGSQGHCAADRPSAERRKSASNSTGFRRAAPPGDSRRVSGRRGGLQLVFRSEASQRCAGDFERTRRLSDIALGLLQRCCYGVLLGLGQDL